MTTPTTTTSPEWRNDPVTKRRVLISPIRAERPFQPAGFCPFCEHFETETTPEVYAKRSSDTLPNEPGWRIRVFPNKYAAVKPQFPVTTSHHEPATGIAEVIVEGASHETAIERQPVTLIAEMLQTWRDRLRFWQEDGQFAFAQVFKNQGPRAGASLSHCHSQLIAIREVPTAIQHELSHAKNVNWHSWLKAEQASNRFVSSGEHMFAVCPLAPRFPGEIWVLPKQPQAQFEVISDADCHELAVMLQEILKRLGQVYHQPDVNIIVKSLPFQSSHQQYCWRIEILPRLVTAAGWEYATDVLINPVPPEAAAEQIRQANFIQETE